MRLQQIYKQMFELMCFYACRLKFLQNSYGGHVMVTSSSSRLLHVLMSDAHPIVRIIIAALKSHLDLFSDGGLSTAILLLRQVRDIL